mmetsp:Transcript_42724/g.117940  ORF Transcript_42724/g.117940 Transcript_42724/m.117940 type:complete len:263 (-) Transcript_42724:3255-4043(-)
MADGAPNLHASRRHSFAVLRFSRERRAAVQASRSPKANSAWTSTLPAPDLSKNFQAAYTPSSSSWSSLMPSMLRMIPSRSHSDTTPDQGTPLRSYSAARLSSDRSPNASLSKSTCSSLRAPGPSRNPCWDFASEAWAVSGSTRIHLSCSWRFVPCRRMNRMNSEIVTSPELSASSTFHNACKSRSGNRSAGIARHGRRRRTTSRISSKPSLPEVSASIRLKTLYQFPPAPCHLCAASCNVSTMRESSLGSAAGHASSSSLYK